VVDHCIARGAYKPFLGATVGHFAVRLGDGRFLTSRRKTDFNRLPEVGLVLVEALGDHEVVAHGSRPSVGGQSQRIVFAEHPGLDCIVHFHCPLRAGSAVPVRSQRPFECGSHECGKNTSDGLLPFGPAWAVMLDRHGPNVVFSRNADPEQVIRFIEDNFDLSGTTAGFPLGAS
jgi:ribulose-5-phosphate 4-epimerase/fuculose-1-phosphate aldolase